MANVTTYNPKKVTCALGNHIMTGYADDSFITIEYTGDGTTYVSGADGEVVRAVDPTNMYTVKVNVLQTSPTNAFLQKKYDQDRRDGSGTFSINITDVLGNEKFTADTAWVTKPASWTRGKTANNREWEIVVGDGNFR